MLETLHLAVQVLELLLPHLAVSFHVRKMVFNKALNVRGQAICPYQVDLECKGVPLRH